MKSSFISLLGAILLGVLFALTTLTGCEPVPGKTLSGDQKIEDMKWLFSRFEEYYAPRDYKADRYKFDYEKLKTQYLAEAQVTTSNEEFYAVMQKFVAEFRDAHTSLSFTPSPLPDRAHIALLGITGKRYGDDFVVTEILPTINPNQYPLKAGDRITHINGTPVLKYIDKELMPYRNVGNAESNHSMLMGALFTRISLNFPMPKDKNIELTYVPAISAKYAPGSLKISMPWIIKDLRDFKLEIGMAKAQISKKNKNSAFWMPIDDANSGKSFDIALLDQNGEALTAADFDLIFNGSKDFYNNYRFISIEGWTTNKDKIKKSEKKSPFEKLQDTRWIAGNALPISEAKFFPAYVSSEDVIDPETKQSTGVKKLVGYVRIDSFEYPEESVADLKNTLLRFQSLGVKDVVVDTLGNPGGSLTLMMKISQAFWNKKLVMPKQQFGLNQWWLDSIQTTSIESTGAQKELFQRLYADLLQQSKNGLRLSRNYSLEEIIPYEVNPNYALKENFNLKILVNEMNASCGDIFPLVMQQNKAALIVGEKTMGAGGNVASFMQAPNSRADLRQTLSLIVKDNGSYLENNGVVPDIKINPNALIARGYAVNDRSSIVVEAAMRLSSYDFSKLTEAGKTSTPTPTPTPVKACASLIETITLR